MSGQKNEDGLTKALGMLIAMGALAAGAAAALMNSERSRQMREELRLRVDDLGKRVDDLSSQAARTFQDKRPDLEHTVEDTIQKGRKVAVDGLERVKSVVEQSADKAQEYVQRAGHQTSRTADNIGDRVEDGIDSTVGVVDDVADDAMNAADNLGDRMERAADEASDAAGDATRRLNNGNDTM